MQQSVDSFDHELPFSVNVSFKQFALVFKFQPSVINQIIGLIQPIQNDALNIKISKLSVNIKIVITMDNKYYAKIQLKRNMGSKPDILNKMSPEGNKFN